MSFEDHLRDDLHGATVPVLRVPDRLADRALAGARRQTRLRAVAIAGVAATTVAMASALPVVRDMLPGGGVNPGTSTCAAAAPLPPRPPAQAWEYFDPLQYEIDATGVAGFQVGSYTTSTYYQVLELWNETRDRLVTVTLYARHGVVHYRTTEKEPHELDPSGGEATDPVNGAPAYWLPETTYVGLPQGQGLAWQWAPEAWVLVTAADVTYELTGAPTPGQSTVDTDVLRDLAAEIAPMLEFGEGTPVTAPFSIAVPACTRVGGTVSLFTGAGGKPIGRFGLRFEGDNQVRVTNPLLTPGGLAIGVDASWGSSPEDKPGSVTSEVDGHPAALGDCPSAAECYNFGAIYGVDGFALELRGGGNPPVSVFDLFQSVRIHPGATHDPATWGPPLP